MPPKWVEKGYIYSSRPEEVNQLDSHVTSLNVESILAGAEIQLLESVDACETLIFITALLKASEGVEGAEVLSIASPGHRGGFPALFLFSRFNAMTSTFRKRQ